MDNIKKIIKTYKNVDEQKKARFLSKHFALDD